jgi:hypothetical protein
MRDSGFQKYVILYVPWVFSWIFNNQPLVSYSIAWLGSFFIFFLTFSGRIKPLPDDRSLGNQLMRPIFLPHIIFAGYMACTTIFYLLNELGYRNFQLPSSSYLVNEKKLYIIAECQRYYCLGHAAFVTGLLVFMKYPVKTNYSVEETLIPDFLLRIAIVSLPVAVVFTKMPGLSQFYYQITSLSFIAGTLALAFAIPRKKFGTTFICAILFLYNFYQALLSGFKEPIIISVLVLGVFLYADYKRIVTVVFVPLLFALFFILPTYVNAFRQTAWSGEVDIDKASEQAVDAALNSDIIQDETNWNFLTFRLSEIDMFSSFIQSTPDKIDYYGLMLLKQSCVALIPRFFWPSKPSTEELVMQRVYDAEVVNRASSVSAKPAFIVDAYLSAGGYGVFIYLFLYGVTTQVIAIKAEQLFGGYIIGTSLVFAGLFQILWRGLSFEFLINSVFWSYVTMLILKKVLLAKGILSRKYLVDAKK